MKKFLLWLIVLSTLLLASCNDNESINNTSIKEDTLEVSENDGFDAGGLPDFDFYSDSNAVIDGMDESSVIVETEFSSEAPVENLDSNSESDFNRLQRVAVAGSPVANYGRLKVVGNKICAENGTPIQLRGMSLFWSQWASQFWNASLVNNQADTWKASVIRAAMGVESGGYLTDPVSQKNMVKKIVDAAIAKGIYVIIDWHDHNATDHLAQSKAFFKEMALLYGYEPNVIFEVFNEPTTQSWLSVKTYAEAVIAEIRSTGSQNLVLVGSPTWSQDVDKVALNPIINYSNIAYTLHFYAGTHKQALRDKALYALNNGIALFVSEWGTCDASGNGNLDLTESTIWLNFLNQYRISSCNWSLFDKVETASALLPGASTTGPWIDSQLTASGKFVKSYIYSNDNWSKYGPYGFKKCANEYGTITFSQKVDVAYGANGKYFYKFGLTGAVTFNNSFFGDPAVGDSKLGFYKPSSIVSNPIINLNSWLCNANSGGLTIWTGGVGDWNIGEWIQFNNVDFGTGCNYIDFQYATNISGSFEVRMDSISGSILSTFIYGSTGNWSSYTTGTNNLNSTQAKGIHTIFIKDTSGAANLGVIKIR